ncbi:MAG: hypothetical protein H7338_19820 [Candidatus Sericytochromatia bacterium]|nr:hypothetical protein [Candidatus Sericytochromatia bacterium]
MNARRRFLKTDPPDPYPGLHAAWQRYLHGEPIAIFAEIDRGAITPGNTGYLLTRMIERLNRCKAFVRVAALRGTTGLWELPWPGADSQGDACAYDRFRLTVRLVSRLEAWQARFDALDPEQPLQRQPFDWGQFHADGRELAVALKDALGDRYYVEYLPLEEIRAGVQLRLWGM